MVFWLLSTGSTKYASGSAARLYGFARLPAYFDIFQFLNV